MDIPDDPNDFKVLDSNALDQIRQRTEILNRINNCIPVHTVTYKPPEVVIPPNPIHETNRLLEEQNDKIADLSTKLEEANLEISKQTQELKSITINDKVEFSTYSNNIIIVTLFGGNEYKLTEDDMYIVKFMEEE